MRIRTKLAIAILVASVVLAGVVLVGLEVFKDRAEGQVRDNVEQTAGQTAEQVDAVVRERVNTVKFYASDPRAADPSTAPDRLNQFVTGTRFYAAQLIEPNGTIVHYRGQVDATDRRAALGRNVSTRPYVGEITDNASSSHVSDVEVAGNQRVVIISAPVFDPATGNLTAVFAGAIRVSEADFFVAARPLVTDRQTVQINATANGSTVPLLERDTTFESSIAETATVGFTGWEVTVAADRAPLNQRLNDLALAQGLGILLVVVVIAGLGFWEYSMNLRQTERLLTAFGHMQAGDYDYTLELSAAEEWQQISDGYNDLARGVRERERAIREREQRLGVLNRLLRHNLRNDMSVILSYAELLPDFDARDRREEAAEKIQDIGQGLIDHGQKARDIETAMESAADGTEALDMVPRVRAAVEEYRGEYPAVEFHLDLPDTCDAMAIPSVDFAVENLIENAAEHNDAENPAVEVTLGRTDGAVELRVADTGPGIPDHEQDVLFEGEETALEHGSGIGLWLAYWVVDKSEGDIEFADNDPRGAIVSVRLASPAPPDGRLEDDADEDADDADAEPTGTVDAILGGGGADAAGGDAAETADEQTTADAVLDAGSDGDDGATDDERADTGGETDADDAAADAEDYTTTMDAILGGDEGE